MRTAAVGRRHPQGHLACLSSDGLFPRRHPCPPGWSGHPPSPGRLHPLHPPGRHLGTGDRTAHPPDTGTGSESSGDSRRLRQRRHRVPVRPGGRLPAQKSGGTGTVFNRAVQPWLWRPALAAAIRPVLPRKSVTALLGISPTPPQPPQPGCVGCRLYHSCQIRRSGRICHKEKGASS